MSSRCVAILVFSFLLFADVTAARALPLGEPPSLAVREAQFDAFQGKWFEAITRLDQELLQRKKDRLVSGERSPSKNIDQDVVASLIDFVISYRMYQWDGVALENLIKTISDEKIRNLLMYRLAKICYHKDQPDKSLHILDRISGEILPELEGELAFFRAQVLLSTSYFDKAIPILDELRKTQSFIGFAGYNRKAQSLLGFTGYNLGIAHLLNGNKTEGRQQLDLAGQVVSEDEMTLSVRDKANLVLGDQLLTDGLYEQAGIILDRSRLDGPFSTQALLSAGWSSAMQENYEQALVPWTLLAARKVTDPAVQEAMLAVPYSYGKLGVYSKAALLYGKAVEAFDTEIQKLKESISSIRDGYFLEAVSQEAFRQDSNWVVKLREHPGMPETDYLPDLMASHDFQEALKNYVDLSRLYEKMNRWQQDLEVYEEMIEKRRAHYQPLLPIIDAEFKKLDLRIKRRMKQRNDIEKQLDSMKYLSRPELLATADERTLLNDIDRLDRALGSYHTVKTRSRINRLRGLVVWSIYTGFDQRLIATLSNFQRLDNVIAALEKQHESYVRIRKAATRSYRGYDRSISALRERIADVLERTAPVMSRQGKLLESMMADELAKRLEKMEQMQVKARFAMADSYDRATRNRGGGAQ